MERERETPSMFWYCWLASSLQKIVLH